ncbi:hypothetical protein ES703_18077 [subsurface metagenome]
MKADSLVAITWLDTVSTDKEHSKSEALRQEPITFVTYGRFLGQTKTKVTIASTEGWDDDQKIYRDITTFPFEVIKAIKEVK